jgi:hypothetical protein
MDLKLPEHALARAILALQLPPEPTFVLHGEGFEATLSLGSCVDRLSQG